MLRPERMVKVRVICHQAALKQVINALYDEKALHLEEHKASKADRIDADSGKAAETPVLDIGSPLPEHETSAQALLQLQTIFSLLAINRGDETGTKPERVSEDRLAFAARRIASLHEKTHRLSERRKMLDDELASLKAERRAAAFAQAFSLSPGQLPERLACFLGTIKDEAGIAKRIADVTDRYELHLKRVDGELAVFLMVDIAFKTEALAALNAAGYAEISFPGQAARTVASVDRAIAATEKARRAVAKEFAKLAVGERAFLLGAERAFSRAVQKSGAPLGFGITERTVIITGWVPASRLDALYQRLETITRGRMLFEELMVDEHDAGPVKLHNPAAVRPFQSLLNLYALPNSHEIDPTLFLFLTFPLLFGFMLGDIGYGLTTLVLFVYLRKKFSSASDLLDVMILCSAWSVVFGVLFGEFFGLEEIGHFAIPHLLARSEGVTELITISLLIGLVHILLGLVLGFINVVYNHGWWHAVKEKGGWILLLPGLAQLLVILGLIEGSAGTFIASWPSPPLIVAAVVGVVLIIIGEGVKGAIELPSILSNVLSYARLMALGIASVSLAIVINQFTEEFAAQGGWMFVAGILIFLVGHIINIALGIIGPFLHSLRLHYVELFTKFFDGGGEEFRPFGVEANE